MTSSVLAAMLADLADGSTVNPVGAALGRAVRAIIERGDEGVDALRTDGGTGQNESNEAQKPFYCRLCDTGFFSHLSLVDHDCSEEQEWRSEDQLLTDGGARRSVAGPIGMAVGPINRDRECDHGGPLLPSDPGVDHVTPCNQSAVVAVPWPDPGVLGARALCPWHLARYLDAFEDRDVLPKLRAHFETDAFVPEHSFLEIDDAPEEIDELGEHWRRVGLDQRGDAHYLDETGDTVLVLTAEFDAETYGIPASGWTGWLTHVRDRRGWAAFDPRVAPDDAGGGGA